MVDDAALHFEVKRVVTREPEPALGWAGRCEAAYLESGCIAQGENLGCSDGSPA